MTTSNPTEMGAQGPPCYRILLEMVDGRRVVLDVPGVHAMGGGGIDPVPGRMSIFQPDPGATGWPGRGCSATSPNAPSGGSWSTATSRCSTRRTAAATDGRLLSQQA